MKYRSKIALAAALAAGISGLVTAAPACAGGKEKPAASAAFSLSAEVRASALTAQNALAANDVSGAAAAISAIDAQASNDDERFVAATLRVKMLVATPPTIQTMKALVVPLDRLIADPRTPKEDLARYYYLRGDVAYAANKFADAQQFYLQAQGAGLHDNELNFQIVRSAMESDATHGAASLDALIAAQAAAGKQAPDNWYRYAMLRLYKANKPGEAVTWATKWLAAYGSKENWRDAIYAYGFEGVSAKDLKDRDRIDLYRLMAAAHCLAGQSDYRDYAAAAIKAGLPAETKLVIEEGRASTAIPAVDTVATQLAAKAKAGIAASKSFAVREKSAATASKGDAALQAGDAYLAARSYARAIPMYDLALKKGGVDTDQVYLHRAIARSLASDKDQARADFALITGAPQTEIAKLWLAWLDSPAAPA